MKRLSSSSEKTKLFLGKDKAVLMKRLSSSYEKTRLFTERGRQNLSDDLITKLFAYLD